MDIAKQLGLEHSKKNSLLILNYVGKDLERVEDLLNVFFESEYRISQRAAMVVGDLGTRFPNVLKPYELKFIEKIKEKEIHDALIRNIVRIWQDFDLENDYLGEYYGICYDFLNDNSKAIAIKVFSMQVCYRVCLVYPELKEELIFIIEENLKKYSNQSAGILSRGNKILKKLKIGV